MGRALKYLASSQGVWEGPRGGWQRSEVERCGFGLELGCQLRCWYCSIWAHLISLQKVQEKHRRYQIDNFKRCFLHLNNEVCECPRASLCTIIGGIKLRRWHEKCRPSTTKWPGEILTSIALGLKLVRADLEGIHHHRLLVVDGSSRRNVQDKRREEHLC